MKKILTCLCMCASVFFGFGQTTGTIKGKLTDTLSKQTLKDASVTVLNAGDSTLEMAGLSKADGSFEIGNIPFGSYIVHVAFQGFDPFYRNISLSKTNAVHDLGNIILHVHENDLGMVTVTQSPITVRNDTIEYNASSFKTKPNAVVEDLLKKFPGMDVDKNGGVKAQGETVQRILVNGKRFFGDDPKLATKNLPPDIVDKIQVFDDLSDQSKFTGFDDGNRVKTINITTKKDKQKGYFGKAVAGAGDNGTYDESINLHRMNGNQQIAIVGQANNINKQSFTSQDFLNGGNGGGRGRSGGGGAGITTSLAGGLNYRDTWGSKTDVSGSYFYNDQRTNSEQETRTQNILKQDSSSYNERERNSLRSNRNHRINFNIESKPDSNNSWVFRPNISFQQAVPSSSSSNLTTADPDGKLVNRSASTSSGTNSGFNINGSNLQFRHRFAKKARTVSLDLGFSAGTNNSQGYNYSINDFFRPVSKTDTLNQYYISKSNSFSFSPTLSYTEPIGRNQILEFNYNFSYSRNNSSNNTYRFNKQTGTYSTFDSLFSNSYNFTSTSNRGSLNYRLQGTKYNFSLGSGIQFTEQNSLNTTKNIQVINKFTNFTPTANFQYNFSKTRNLRVNYNGRTGQPSIQQLQPLVTTSDSINFQIGNPDLKPQFTHSLRVLYHSFDPVTQRVFMFTVNASAVHNDIQSSVIQNANGGRTSTSVNLDGTYAISGYLNYGFPLKNPKSNLNFTTNVNYNQAQTLVNKQSNFTRNTQLSQTIKWTTNLKDNFDMNFSATTSYTIARNSLQSTQNANYYSQSFSTEATYYTDNGWIVSADFDYTYTGNRTGGFSASVPLLNPSIAKQFLKNNAGELRLSVFDLLNQNQSVTRSVTGSTIQDQRSTVLTRYAMLTFTYNLRQFGAKPKRRPFMQATPRNGNGGGMIRQGGGRPGGMRGGRNEE
ncbi:outer membrane beta-barrel family protein [Sediminibacterium ginsengisoli]|uniref:Outer membrane receptor proteins, mostly Fe transport n=1 Tax=Sediminibacterium ginsengisoli TaxID=413434 RepID=A0A1T4L5W8_9BACT|nr:outer membrane beta-barrel family protein [Sediminibacterium ginsengisoli]SJZ49931.1 Outer membrane receptor proteins, mostly Fe transport [Sediminibacterium ginsengisoli]